MRIIFILIFLLFINTTTSQSEAYNLKKLVELEEPWGSTFINNNEIIVTEKNGKIKIVNINSKNTFEVKHNLNFLNVGQGGLLDIIYQDNIFGFHILKIEVMVKQVLQLLKQY
jgi:quinoprotein glucose dehydrogenase